jgi:diguanylate cyclase (GGDEF)-like protein
LAPEPVPKGVYKADEWRQWMNLEQSFFSAIYRYAPIGLVILDANAAVVDANDYMFHLFQVDKEEYRGKQFGNIFNCSNVVDSDRICGQAEACTFCKLRAGLVQGLTSHLPLQELELMNAHKVGGVDKPLWLKLSASTVESEGEDFLVVSFTDITREKQYEELLQHDLTIDGATGTINKHSLIEILKELPGFAESNTVVSVGIVDMDDFKLVNDHYGHLMGDRVLESFSRLARDSMRKQDIIGRFGGEEFMFVFPGVDLVGASSIMERIHRALTSEFAQKVEGIGFSAGFIRLDSETIRSLSTDDIIETVDELLYQAKDEGKRRFATPEWTVSLQQTESEE